MTFLVHNFRVFGSVFIFLGVLSLVLTLFFLSGQGNAKHRKIVRYVTPDAMFEASDTVATIRLKKGEVIDSDFGLMQFEGSVAQLLKGTPSEMLWFQNSTSFSGNCVGPELGKLYLVFIKDHAMLKPNNSFIEIRGWGKVFEEGSEQEKIEAISTKYGVEVHAGELNFWWRKPCASDSQEHIEHQDSILRYVTEEKGLI